jgi:DNA-binding IclR family transcriptional regulator
MVQSVERAFTILDALARRPDGVTGVAQRVRLPKSTVARLLASLEELGAVERLDGPRWRVGRSVELLAGAASPERRLVAVVRTQLRALVDELGEAAGLALPDGYDVLYVDQVESDRPVQVRDWTGTRAPLHTVPSGLVLLAAWPADAVDGYLARDLERLTPHTVVEAGALRSRLAEARASGVAWGHEEFAEGITSVAAPVRDAEGRPVAAIHVHGPAYRFPPPGHREAIAARVVAAAATAGRRLAHDAA